MLNSIIDASLRYKLLVIIAFVVVAGLGIRAWQKVPVDAFPDVTPVQVNIYTESPGLASEDVEQLLSFPIESALAGLPKVQEIRSVSLFGLSYVAVYFEDDMDIYFARRLVAERLQEVGDRLPAGYGTPEMGPNTSGLGQVFWYTVERAEEKLKAEKLKNAPSDMEYAHYRTGRYDSSCVQRLEWMMSCRGVVKSASIRLFSTHKPLPNMALPSERYWKRLA